MIIVAIQHPVADYDAWKAVYDASNPGTMGAVFARVNRMVGNPNMITVVAGFETLAAAEAAMNSSDLKDAMKEAGVTGEPRIELYEEIEAVQY